MILGAGGHAREVLDVVRHADGGAPAFLGFLADDPPDPVVVEAVGATWLGPIERLRDIEAAFVVGIGDPVVRRALDEQAVAWGRSPARLWHRTAHRAAGVEAGPGTVVLANASVTSNVRLGRHVHVNLNATVAHDCVLGDYVTVNPGANVNGNVVIEPAATIGSGAVVRQGVTIGEGAVVGAGAVVVHDVPPGTTVVGIPARPL